MLLQIKEANFLNLNPHYTEPNFTPTRTRANITDLYAHMHTPTHKHKNIDTDYLEIYLPLKLNGLSKAFHSTHDFEKSICKKRFNSCESIHVRERERERGREREKMCLRECVYLNTRTIMQMYTIHTYTDPHIHTYIFIKKNLQKPGLQGQQTPVAQSQTQILELKLVPPL